MYLFKKEFKLGYRLRKYVKVTYYDCKNQTIMFISDMVSQVFSLTTVVLAENVTMKNYVSCFHLDG